MNWKLVLLLSMFGLGMSVATVFVIPSRIEPLFWVVIFATCAALIARYAPGKFFLHGLMTSLANAVWITTAHVLFFDTYVVNHVQEVQAFQGAPLPLRAMMVVTGPIFGLVSGLVLGGLSWLASKLIKRSPSSAERPIRS